ncbi:ankyrin repeat domain-containing protein 16-like [Dreissena polymorpha]|uniref:Ankyrin repeat domain-containing protein 16 n=1 Tax=Dreissena polymorpha TaxID=45954 RepID=A0A9D4MN03_DREPO|nr:ankyrin repeat domain-containing protein 16-like [Dreissena polymorpha]KAH3880250.1 hypothetical protein DPMN_004160 [Dreissena polymorpha]
MDADIARASQAGDIEYFQHQLKNDVCKRKIIDYFHPKSGDTVVHYASRNGHVRLLQHFAVEGFSLEITNFDGKRPLHEAAHAGQNACVTYLLSAGVVVDPLKRADWTPLMLACSKVDLYVVQELVNHGANLKLKNKDGWNCFHVAVREGNLDIIAYLLDCDSTLWDTVSLNGRSPLHTAALHGHVGVVRYLLEACHYVTDTQDSCGSTPLMDAVREDSIGCMELLIHMHCADVFKVDNLGRQCVHVACQTGSLNSLVCLVETHRADQGIHISPSGAMCLHIAAKEGHVNVISYLLQKKVNIDAQDSKGRTALHIAAGAQKADCVRVLLKHGASIMEDQTGSTPKQLALKPEVTQIFEHLEKT